MRLIDPEATLNAVQKLFIEDAEIINHLDLTDATIIEKAKSIIKRSQYNDLADSKSRLCIYFRPSRRMRNQIATEEVLQIDCHVPVSRDYYAYRVIKRVNKLLHNQVVGGRKFYYDAELGDLPTAQNYFCVGIRFNFHATVINP